MIYEQLLHILADDSRARLGSIQDATEELLAAAAGSPLREKLARVHHEVWALSTLIHDLSNFYAHSAGRLGDQETDFDLRVTLEGVRSRFSRSRPQSDWIALTKIRHDVPTLLRGQPARLQDILLGATAGILSARSPGSLRIDVTKAWERDQRVELVFRCTLCPQESPTAAEVAAFREALAPAPTDGPLPREHLRTELARRLAAVSEGSLTALADDGATMAFELRLPFSTRSMATSSAASGPLPSLRGHRVLVVDSDAARRADTGALTRLWGLLTEGAANGRDAMHALRLAAEQGRPFDLALIDAELADMAGMMLGRLARLEPPLAATGLVLQFRVGLRGDGARAGEVGFDAYLPRALPAAELRDALAVLVQRRGSDRSDHPLLTRHSLADLQLEGVRILLVGSDPLGTLVLDELLGRKGFRVERVADLDEAAARCEHHAFELIVLDLGVPTANGLALAAAFQALVEERSPTPIAVLYEASGRGEDRDLAGFIPDAAFPKPVDLEHLCEYCEGLLFPHLAMERAQRLAAPRTADGAAPASDGATPAFEPLWLDAATMGIGSLKRSVIDSYLTEMPGRVDALGAAIASGDPVAAEREVLGARAMALMIGAVSTARCLVALAEHLHERRIPEAQAMMARVRAEAERGLGELREVRARIGDAEDRAA